MQLTTFTDYALRTLIYLAMHKERLCTAKEIANFHHISLNHITKVVHRLAVLKIILSQKGKGGGIQFRQTSEMIKLGKTIKQLENNFHLAKCFNPNAKNCLLLPQCRLKSILGSALEDFFKNLEQYTLADLIPNSTKS